MAAAGRALLLGVAVVLGATLGQVALITIDSRSAAQGLPSLIARVLRWSLVAASVAGIYFLRRRSIDARAAAGEAELRRVQLERQETQARLQTLRNQIEPHFLFNTLATVRRLHHTEPAGGAQLLAQFLDYLRLALPGRPEQSCSLGEELDLVSAYLGVVAVRMSRRLEAEYAVAHSLRGAAFPPLILATLVENAVKHGIGPAAAGGAIRVCARRDSGMLEVDVADTGVGFRAGRVGDRPGEYPLAPAHAVR